MLRLPWRAWCETDLLLGMAADLHDHLLCTCGCGQWEADAHDPLKKDRWRVDEEVCYVRRTLDAHVKANEPAPDVVISVRLAPEGADDTARGAYDELRARFPSLAASKAKAEQDTPGDNTDDDRRDE